MDRLNDSIDYGGDAAVGSFFSTDYKKNDDLKQMLDSNRDNLKLEAMKRIIGLIAKGRDASDLFPAVVKNVVSKNPEVKKLVYVYLVRYAEEQQDLALLSISTFQRALKDPNQLIRASALRVLSSIRVNVIVPIVMLAIRESAADMSPYVRKTAAHAIPKLFTLDPEQKEELVTILDKLLADRTTLVVGSAVMAFEEVCPERIDLIHKNYRKLCSLVVDVDEWGQVVILNTLTRYARTQFLDPNIGDVSVDGEERPFYDDEDENQSENETHKKSKKEEVTKILMDPDHRLLLKNCRPLLQSRSASVVMTVVQLYHHLAPKSEVHIVTKPLIRLLRSHPEVQAVVLTCIAAMSTNRKTMFEPYMKNFFVRSSDPLQIKLFKLEILTNIANESNIPLILREFQNYIASQDKEFISATIEAIGRCASNIKEVAQTCLNGLVSLLSHRDPAVVGGAVVVAKTLLQSQKSSGNKAVIAQLAKMVDRVHVAPARAAILWLLGEHSEKIPNLPPDVLRKMAKSFPDEENEVKLQIMNLAAKLQLTNPSQTTLLCQYVLNLAKYDQSYDIRDRGRFLRQLLFPENSNSLISKHAKKILLSSKPAPVLESKFNNRDHFQLGSLSHYLNMRASGYRDLPVYPSEAPDPTVRNVEITPPYTSSTQAESGRVKSSKKGGEKNKGGGGRSFYSDEEEESGSSSGSGSQDTSSSSSSSSSSESGSESGTESSTEEEEVKKSSDKLPPRKKVVHYNETHKRIKNSRGSESGTVSSSSSTNKNSSSSSSSSDESEEEVDLKSKVKTKEKVKVNDSKSKKVNENVSLLLDLDLDENIGSNLGPTINLTSFNSPLSPTTTTQSSTQLTQTVQDASPMYIPQSFNELINKISTGGLQINGRFTRGSHIFSNAMVSVELQFINLSKDVFSNIKIGQKILSSGTSVHDFEPIASLLPSGSILATVGIDFSDSSQAAKIEIEWGIEAEKKKCFISIKPTIGEILKPVSMSESYFLAQQAKLRGMNEADGKVVLGTKYEKNGEIDAEGIIQRIYEALNVIRVPSTQDDVIRFSGRLLSSLSLVLVSIHLFKRNDGGEEEEVKKEIRIVVNCEKMVIGSLLLQELKEALK